MIPASFDYYRAHTVDEALTLLHDHEDAKLLAGGHSLLPMMKLRLAQPATLVDIGRIDELRGVTHQAGTVRVGALTTHGELARCEILAEHGGILAEAASHIGDIQVRHRGTVGGNIAHADPASDLPAVLLALGATIHVKGRDSERVVPADDFFVDLLATDLGEDELLTAVSFPCLGSGDASAYLKVEHPASGYAICGAAAVLRGKHVRLAWNGVTATPLSSNAVDDSLSASDLSDAAIAEALTHLAIDDPLSDIQADGEYRSHLARVYGRRAVATARDRRS